MTDRRLAVLRSTALRPADVAAGEVVAWEQFRHRIEEAGLLRSLWRFPGIDLITRDIDRLHRPLATALLFRLLTLRPCALADEAGRERSLGWIRTFTLGLAAVRDRLAGGRLRARVDAQLRALAAEVAAGRAQPLELRRERRPLHLRTDLVFGLSSGGSVGHIAGVLNHIGEFVAPPVFATTDCIPTVDDTIETYLLAPPARWWEFAELLMLACNEAFRAQLEQIAPQRPAFVYHRLGAHSFVGLEVAWRRAVPLVIEFNGSERWIARNWGGTPLVYDALAGRIERLVLSAADLVVAGSDAGRDQAVECGARPETVLVNPNGVDTDRFRPDIDGMSLRRRLGAVDRLVVGFIGSFGPWHGSDRLAEAFCRWMAAESADRKRTTLLLIGDGPLLPEVRQTLASRGLAENVHCAGRVPQHEAPEWLAACDILVSPHVPNPDGSRFFGSPTKLFEYMAMGRAIVASRLEQIGEVLDHERTALLVPPGDIDALQQAMRRLADDAPLRARLGAAARERAERQHTWRSHAQRIVDALEARIDDSTGP